MFPPEVSRWSPFGAAWLKSVKDAVTKEIATCMCDDDQYQPCFRYGLGPLTKGPEIAGSGMRKAMGANLRLGYQIPVVQLV